MPGSGRVTKIINRVLTIANDRREDFVTAEDVVLWINECTEVIARAGYWQKEATLDTEAGVAVIELLDEITDFVDLHTVRWTDTDILLMPVPTMQDFINLKGEGSALATQRFATWYYWLSGTTLHIVPTPTETASDALTAVYSYLPTELTETVEEVEPEGEGEPEIVGDDTPKIPPAFDNVYLAFARTKLAEMDRGGRTAMEDYPKYQAMFRRELSQLLSAGTVQDLRLRPYR